MQQGSRTSLHAEEQPLYKVFGDDYSFRIPPYQRPYSWTTEEAGTLLDDLVSALQQPDGDSGPYFLGSIVLIKSESDPLAEVVDGQQRLTTLTILLCALRELAEPDAAKQLNEFVYEKGNVFRGSTDQFRLTPRNRDESFFRDHIQKPNGLTVLAELLPTGLSDSQLNFKKNSELFMRRLSGMTDSQRVSLAAYMMQNCYLVVVSASDRDAAYRIFSVMNNRGLDLSPTDILKAEIIGSIEEGPRPDYTSKWEDKEVELGRKGFEDLFGHIRMIYRKSKPQGTLVSEFKRHVEPLKDPKAFVDNVLSPMSRAFQAIKDASYEAPAFSEQINMSLRWLNRIDNVDWVPPVISYFREHYHEPQAVAGFIADMERLAYGLFIMRTFVNERIVRFSRIQAEIDNRANLQDPHSALQLTQTECANIKLALDGDIYSQVKTRLPLLLRLDAALTEGGVYHTPSIITVEHVLPQNPSVGSEWLKNFPDTEKRLDLTNRLGNLVLLSRSKNSKAQNFDFERKKREYFMYGNVSTFALTSQVMNHDKWTPDIIGQRQADLLARLCRVWRI